MKRIALTDEEREQIATLAHNYSLKLIGGGPVTARLAMIVTKMRGEDIISKLLRAGFVAGESHRGEPAMLLADPAGNGTAAFTDRTGTKLPCEGDWALEIRTWSHPDDDAETDIQCDDTRFQAGLVADPTDELVQVDEVIDLAVKRIADVAAGI